jgi:hypothetical protein
MLCSLVDRSEESTASIFRVEALHMEVAFSSETLVPIN